MSRELALKRFDPLFIVIVVLLSLLGIALVYSATWDDADRFMQSLWFKQTIYVVVGFGLIFLITILPDRFFQAIAWPFYFVSILLLIYVALGGGAAVESKGAGRWIQLPGFNLQPSELAKLAYLLVLSRYLSGKVVRLEYLANGFIALITLWPLRRRIKEMLSQQSTVVSLRTYRRGLWEMWLGPLFLVPFLLILKQPDLGTALVFITMTLVMFFWTGMPLRELFLLISVGLSMLTSIHLFVWALFILLLVIVLFRSRLSLWLTVTILAANLLLGGYGASALWNKGLEDHQKSRILTFIDPDRDDRGAGYQVRQSFVAIGSGGLMGKGFLEGSQTNLDFLPEEHTDFIFGVLGEQFGFIGCSLVLAAFLILLARAIQVTTRTGDSYGNLVVVGAVSILAFHVIVNVAMTIGLMPVTGLPLPFLSYGGSFMMTVMTLCGLVIHVRFRNTVA